RVLRDERQDGGGVRVTSAQEDGSAATVEARFGERADIEQTRVALGVKLGPRLVRLGRDDGPGETPVACRIAAGIEIDVRDETGVDDGRTGADVKQVRHLHPVEKVADVPGRSAAHVEKRQTRSDRRDAGQRFDGAERIAESPGQLAYFGPTER